MASFNPPKHPGAHLKDEETGSETFTGVKETPRQSEGQSRLVNAQLSSLPCTLLTSQALGQPPRRAAVP